MSVINDMLRDLEQRKAVGREGMNHAGSVCVVETPGASTLRNWVLLLLVALLALGLGVWVWRMPSIQPVVEPVLDSMEKPVINSEQVVSVPPALDDVKTQVESVVPEKTDSAISVAIEKPAQAVAVPVATPAAPLTEPVDISEPEPGQVLANKEIVESKLPPQQDVIAEEKLPVKESPVFAEKQESSPDQQQEAEELLEKHDELPLVELAPDVAVSDAAPRTIVLSLTPQAQDQKLAAQAQEMIRRGEVVAAVQRLQQFIATTDVAQKSRFVLVNYLLQQGRVAHAGEVLADTAVDSDPDLRQLKARWLIASGRPQEGVSLLESNMPPLAKFPDYHALLASYYQQLGQAEPAAKVYAELLQFNPAQANWWAGRALALDRLARYDEAKIAYQRALVLPGLSEQLAQFSKQRLENL